MSLYEKVRLAAFRRRVSMASVARKIGVSHGAFYEMLSGTWSGPRPGKVSKDSPARKRLERWLREGAKT
jgi:hypothetical protein